jgi:hypothetical protein
VWFFLYKKIKGFYVLIFADTFGDSLKFVHRLYNKRFGSAARKVIAHMPHYINKVTMEQLVVCLLFHLK